MKLFLFLASLQALMVCASAQSWETLGRSKFVNTTDGVRIHCLDRGAGPAILFVPGWTMPAEIWEHQIVYFAKNHHVVAMDPRSQGRSSDCNEGHYPAARARDIKAVVDALKLAPVVLVGWSLGAPEVVSYVDQFGTQTVQAIVLVDGNVGGEYQAEGTGAFLRQIGALQRDREAVTSNFVRSMFKKPQSEEYLSRITAASLRTPSNTALALLMGLITTDLQPALGKIDRPALLFVGGHSPDHAAKLKMQKQVPGAQIEVYEDLGHALFADDPARFNERLEKFLKQP